MEKIICKFGSCFLGPSFGRASLTSDLCHGMVWILESKEDAAAAAGKYCLRKFSSGTKPRNWTTKIIRWLGHLFYELRELGLF